MKYEFFISTILDLKTKSISKDELSLISVIKLLIVRWLYLVV